MQNKTRPTSTTIETLLSDFHGRSEFIRRRGEITRSIIIDHGGEDQCSESCKQLIGRFATVAALLEQMEVRLAHGEKIQITEHALMCNTLLRLAQVIGVDRRSRDLAPTLSDYLRSDQIE
jgi:hypothetical protein